MNEDRKAVRVKVTGRVQGVSYRYWTERQAVALGLSGWVRNEADGSVSALIAGAPGAVDIMLERLKDGPPHARVSGVKVEDANVDEVPAGFRVTG